MVALSPSFVTFDVRPSGMASFGGFDLFWLFTIVIYLVFFLFNYVVYCSQKMQCCPWMMDDQKGLPCISRTLKVNVAVLELFQEHVDSSGYS